VRDSLLAAEHGDDLGLRVDGDAEPIRVEGRDGFAERGEPAVRRVLVRGRLRDRALQRLDDRRRRRQVRVADPERDDVDPLPPS
jgi:hypothetical protein